MEILANQRVRIRTYLLGYLEPTEVESFEEQLLTNEEFLLEFRIAKDELVDDYLSGELPEVDRKRFEEHFLTSPNRVMKLNLASVLGEMAAVSDIQRTAAAQAAEAPVAVFPPGARWQRYWPIAAGIAVILLSGFVVWRVLQDRSRQPPVRDAQRVQFESELAKLNESNLTEPYDARSSVALKPVFVRGIGDDRRVVLDQAPPIVVLQLELAGDIYNTYSASFQTDEGVELATIPNLKPIVKDKVLIIKLPRNALTIRGYQIKLSGSNGSEPYENAGTYPFQVVKS